MKKLIMLTGLILLLGVTVCAQKPGVGITGKGFKIGLDFASINTDYEELDDFLDSKTGFSGGAFLTYSLNRQFAVQPELLFVMKGGEKGAFIFSAEWSLNYIEVPILLKFDLMPQGPAHPNLFAGPAASFLLSSEISALGYSYDVAEYLKSIDFGLVFGAGLDYKRVTFDIRYTLGLAGVIDAADKWNEFVEAEPGDYLYLEGDPSVKNNNISIMVGIQL